MKTKKVAFPETLHDAIKYFANEDRALDFMKFIRWPDGVVKCPRCGSANVSFLSTRRIWKCKSSHEKQQFSVTVRLKSSQAESKRMKRSSAAKRETCTRIKKRKRSLYKRGAAISEKWRSWDCWSAIHLRGRHVSNCALSEILAALVCTNTSTTKSWKVPNLLPMRSLRTPAWSRNTFTR